MLYGKYGDLWMTSQSALMAARDGGAKSTVAWLEGEVLRLGDSEQGVPDLTRYDELRELGGQTAICGCWRDAHDAMSLFSRVDTVDDSTITCRGCGAWHTWSGFPASLHEFVAEHAPHMR